MDTEVKFDIGTKCLFNVHTPVTVADVDGDFRLIEWIAEQGQKMNYAAHISRLLPIDAPQFTYERALNKHRLAICDDCEKTSILETFCYDCGACAKCCQCEDDFYGTAYEDSEWDPDETVYEDDDWEDPNEAVVPGSMNEIDFDDGYDDTPWPDASDDDPTDYDS